MLKKIKNFLFFPRFHFNRLQFNLVALFFLTVGFVAGSYLTLLKLFPSVFAANNNFKTWTFSLTTSSDYTKSLTAVDNSGAHPSGGVMGANQFSNSDFSSGEQDAAAQDWSVEAVVPAGWVEVPGNPTFYSGSYNGNFLLMKYEAKAWDTQSGSVVAEGGGSQGWAGNNSQTRYQARSITDGKPWIFIAQNHATNFDAREACLALGGAYHLVNNNEWMTVTRNAVGVTSNWTNGEVGNGLLFRGNSNGNNALDGSNALNAVNTRTLTLSNGQVVWDLAGNVSEWTNNTQSSAINTTSSYVDWNHANVAAGAIDLYGPPNGYLSDKGMGQIFGGPLNGGFQRGGAWAHNTSAGVFALWLDREVNSQAAFIGFRCASDPVAVSQSFSSNSGRSGGGSTVSVGSVTDGKIYQSVNVGDTATYDFSAYVKRVDEGEVNTSVAELFYGGNQISNSDYEPVGDHWYKLSGTVTGVASSVKAGLLVKAGKVVLVDNFMLAKRGNYTIYTTDGYYNDLVSKWDAVCEGTMDGSNCSTDAQYDQELPIKYQICTADSNGEIVDSNSDGKDDMVINHGQYCESEGLWQYWDNGAWVSADSLTEANSASALTTEAMQALTEASTTNRISFKIIFAFDGGIVPTLPHLSVGFVSDSAIPVSNGKNITMFKTAQGEELDKTCDNNDLTCVTSQWTNQASPFFSWEAGVDNDGGSGIKGYCLYLGQNQDGSYNTLDTDADPHQGTSLLAHDQSPLSTAGTTCNFMISATEIDFSETNHGWRTNTWLETSDNNNPYYFKVWAIDHSLNIYPEAASFKFYFDNTSPRNSAFISCASGSFNEVTDMNFSWPTTGGKVISSDTIEEIEGSGILGWQYQINTTDANWLGTTNSSFFGLDYIPATSSAYTLTMERDCPGGEVGESNCSIVNGNNVVYFRTVDKAGNPSSDASIRTCNLAYGGQAPYFNNTDVVVVTPGQSNTNLFALSWPAATAANDRVVAHYYYSTQLPPSSLTTLKANTSTYIDNGTARTVPATALAGVNKGDNTVYVVAVDDQENYSPSNFIIGSFNLNSSDPDNVGALTLSDSSIKSESKWLVTLSWTKPAYQGAGNLTYLVYRSTDGETFTSVGSTAGLSYVDNTPSSQAYFYKVYTKDGANARSSGTNAVTITPTGKWTSAPSLSSGPEVSSITTKKATITWSTSRTADSKVQFGTDRGKFGEVEPSNSSQVTAHSILLSGLNPDTTYYYKVKWTDEDGNTGTSVEKSFSTASAPTVKDVSAKNIGLASAIIEFTSNNASKVKIYYGTSTAFGGVKEIATSTLETTYTAELAGLIDGTKYYYKINTFDSEGSEYEGTILDFTTLPRPKITNVRIQQVANTAQSTILVTWTTNTEVSSIVTYYPQGSPSEARDEVNVALIKGSHRMIIRGMLPQTNYILVVKGRDIVGNEASSDGLRLTTATDTRPPQISELHVEGSNIPPVSGTGQESTAQLIVSWTTDEPATSQVEFAEGTGVTYSSKTQEDSNLTFNHLVIISNLTSSKVYHLRAISKDKAGNNGNSIDTVTITPKATENALNLVIGSLQEVFSFLGGLRR